MDPETLKKILETRGTVRGNPLYRALFRDRLENTKLLTKGAEINCIGGTLGAPIHVAWKHCYFDISTLLLDRGAKIALIREAEKMQQRWFWEL
ncbi:hypothetical protein K432DRAFT_385551 [Lepidopterella palustris CBS 459.81]|uniref:Ankyrin n=1 Tax=Lepidopterella palustris CBS 459.81 TaxID=1314670 RepID=A0A8E2E2Q0_9PEZI|nr:hypothetical protein K432DRAFT_385551 [Lepidopterella palustris CBS 459.81]